LVVDDRPMAERSDGGLVNLTSGPAGIVRWPSPRSDRRPQARPDDSALRRSRRWTNLAGWGWRKPWDGVYRRFGEPDDVGPVRGG